MTKLAALKLTRSVSDLAPMLGYKPSALAYILYGQSDAEKYKKFTIPKKYGGSRSISSPTDKLKLVQTRLAVFLQDCLVEIENSAGIKDKVSHGFKPDCSIKSNAQVHHNRRFVFNIDLENFFGSINFGRVRGYLITDKNFGLTPKVATVIAQIACFENALPQGSPCSPVISNLIGRVLDVHLSRLAKKGGVMYSRYADDITFSTNKKQFPIELAFVEAATPNHWQVGGALLEAVNHSGFSINKKKTRMQYCTNRQEVTGLTVNKRVNTTVDYRKKVRAMAKRLFATGSFDHIYKVKDNTGKITSEKIFPGKLQQLHGMFGFIWDVDHPKIEAAKDEDGKKKKHVPNYSSRDLMFRSFLFFKMFYAAEQPTILTEGKTDPVYLSLAIKKLHSDYPQLCTLKDGKPTLAVRFHNNKENIVGSLLSLAGGSGHLGLFISSYIAEMKKFKSQPSDHPIIIFLDNDAGADQIVKSISKITSKEITREEVFIHIVKNLYVVLTPIKKGQTSTIEDFFDPALLKTELDGKKFSAKKGKDKDAEDCYGKHIFAQKVIKPNAGTIDFTKFGAALDRLDLVINDWKTKNIHPVRFPPKLNAAPPTKIIVKT